MEHSEAGTSRIIIWQMKLSRLL